MNHIGVRKARSEPPLVETIAEESESSDSSKDDLSGMFKVGMKIGQGAFGTVHEAINKTTGAKVAIKIQRMDSKVDIFLREAKFYRSLQGDVTGVPRLFAHGRLNNHHVLALELLGPSLNDLLHRCGGKFSLKTVLLLADQILQILQDLHSQHILHRDIKPANFTIGVGAKRNVVHVIDLGLAEFYRDPVTREHIAEGCLRRLTGTTRFASLNAHMYMQLSRRDDMESLGYMLIYLYLGRLPWQSVMAPSRLSRYKMIHEMKKEIRVTTLCANMPPEFCEYVIYCRALGFEDTPDYEKWRGVFRRLGSRHHVHYDRELVDFDWNVPKLSNLGNSKRYLKKLNNCK